MKGITTALVVVFMATSLSLAGTAGLAWDEAAEAEGYRVYWRAPSTSYNATDLVFLPVCGGYYDTTPPSLVEGTECVNRTAPAATITLPDTPPVLILSVKGVNEVAESAEFSNEVRKHNGGPGNPARARRTDDPPAPAP